MSSPNPQVLILFAHPAIQKSRINRAMAQAVRDLPGVTFHDLYEHYPDLFIDVAREQELLVAHHTVVIQHPFYWYSTPAIIKEWCDLVLEYGFAYGEKGTSLEGKAWVHALTAGGSEEAYRREGHNRFTIRELLSPFDQTAYLCGMKFLDPFVVYRALSLESEKEILEVARNYREFILSLTRRKKL